jgi:hypothetical protein
VIVVQQMEAVVRIVKLGLRMEAARLRLADQGNNFVVLLGLGDRRNLRRDFGKARRKFGRGLMLRLPQEDSRRRLRVAVFFLCVE